MKRFLLDTNAVVALLNGNERLGSMIEDIEWLGISIVSKIEFLALPELPDEDRELFEEFEKRIGVVDLCNSDAALLNEINELRKSKSVKLPDAVILASGKVNRAMVVTADKQLLRNYPDYTTAVPDES